MHRLALTLTLACAVFRRASRSVISPAKVCAWVGSWVYEFTSSIGLDWIGLDWGNKYRIRVRVRVRVRGAISIVQSQQRFGSGHRGKRTLPLKLNLTLTLALTLTLTLTLMPGTREPIVRTDVQSARPAQAKGAEIYGGDSTALQLRNRACSTLEGMDTEATAGRIQMELRQSQVLGSNPHSS